MTGQRRPAAALPPRKARFGAACAGRCRVLANIRWSSLYGLVLVLLLVSCGGGSVGTGTEPRTRTTFTGSVSSESGAPVAGAEIRLLNTNESTTTAADGSFTLDSTLAGGNANFVISAGGVEGSVDVNDLPADGAAVNLEVTVDFANRSVTLNNLNITAKIEGACDPYFENSRTIRQSGRVPDGTRCPLRVRTRSAAGPVSGLQFVLQRKRCFDGAPWHDVGTGVTGEAAPGVGELVFSFSNDEQHCVYRIVVPVGLRNVRSQEFLVSTFRKQAFDAGQPFDPEEGDGR